MPTPEVDLGYLTAGGRMRIRKSYRPRSRSLPPQTTARQAPLSRRLLSRRATTGARTVFALRRMALPSAWSVALETDRSFVRLVGLRSLRPPGSSQFNLVCCRGGPVVRKRLRRNYFRRGVVTEVMTRPRYAKRLSRLAP